MMEKKIQYYRVESGPCFDALTDYRKRLNNTQSAHFKFAESVGGCGVYSGSDENVGNGIPIYAVIFDGQLPTGWKKASSRFQQGGGKVAGTPNKSTKLGKSIQKEIDALPFKPSPHMVAKTINAPSSISYEKEDGRGSCHIGGFFGPNIAWIRNVFYIGLGDFKRWKAEYEKKGYTVTTADWEPLDGMEAVLKERVDLDFAEAAQRETA